MRDMKEKVKGMKNKRVLREDPRTFTYREKEEQGRGGLWSTARSENPVIQVLIQPMMTAPPTLHKKLINSSLTLSSSTTPHACMRGYPQPPFVFRSV